MPDETAQRVDASRTRIAERESAGEQGGQGLTILMRVEQRLDLFGVHLTTLFELSPNPILIV